MTDLHEFAQQQHVETFAKLCEAERVIARQRAELDEWERLHPEPVAGSYDDYTREMVEIYAPGILARLESAEARASLEAAARRVELAEANARIAQLEADGRAQAGVVERATAALRAVSVVGEQQR